MELTDIDRRDLKFLKFTDVTPFHIASYAGWEKEQRVTESLSRIPAVRVKEYYRQRYINGIWND